MAKLDRQKYASMYGPTVGDKIRLADTELFAEIERELHSIRRRKQNSVEEKLCEMVWLSQLLTLEMREC